MNESKKLKRNLKARHLTMIAIGGSIGTGLFVASGATISQAGPAGAILSYMLIGIMVYFLMTSLGELASFLPVSGTFATYGSRFVDPSFGFAVGWNYWYNWAITIAVDLVAAQLIISYWADPSSSSVIAQMIETLPKWVWSAIFLSLIFSLNYISVKGFGESEFWFSSIKVVTIILFIIIGLAMILGILKSDGEEVYSWSNWTKGEAPFVGGFFAMIGVAMVVGFSFQGTELIGVAAGESDNPEKNIPKSIKQIFWRILLFYILSIFIISLIIPYDDPNLLKNDVTNISVSPFSLVFKKAGLLFAASLMNSVILTSILSAGNSGLYASTRMLYAMAKEGNAPKIFSRLSKNGVPRFALIATTIISMLCFLTSFFQDQQVYNWLLNFSGMTGFIAWISIAISHYRFRKGLTEQGFNLNKLPYKAKWFPFGPIFAFTLCIIIIAGQNYEMFFNNIEIDWKQLLATYASLPIFIIIYLTHKTVYKTKLVKYKEMNFSKENE